MVDLAAVKRARMACRIYLKLFDAGSAGANITKADAIGPRDSEATDFPIAVEVIARLVGDAILDETRHQGGVPHYALTPSMRDRMDRHMPEVGTYAERLRFDLVAYDTGDEVPPGNFIKIEAAIRTGYSEAGPL